MMRVGFDFLINPRCRNGFVRDDIWVAAARAEGFGTGGASGTRESKVGQAVSAAVADGAVGGAADVGGWGAGSDFQ